MDGAIRLQVWRRLDNCLEGLPDDSDRPVELHVRRKQALHEVFSKEEWLGRYG
jgi:hypothetical protein